MQARDVVMASALAAATQCWEPLPSGACILEAGGAALAALAAPAGRAAHTLPPLPAQVNRELRLITTLSHANIIRGICSFCDESALYLVQVRAPPPA